MTARLLQADVEALRTAVLAETDSFVMQSSDFQRGWSAEVRTSTYTGLLEVEAELADRAMGAGSGGLGS